MGFNSGFKGLKQPVGTPLPQSFPSHHQQRCK